MIQKKSPLNRAAMGVLLLVAPVLAGCGSGSAQRDGETATQSVEKPAESGTESEAARAVEQVSASPLEEQAKSGDPQAQMDLGLSLLGSDAQAATGWLEQAAMQGVGAAAYHLGLMQSDPKRAVEWFSMASAMGYVGAHYEMGRAYLHGRGTAKETGWGLMWLERAARAGDADAQLELGRVLNDGRVIRPHRRTALTWALIAEANGNADAQALVAKLKTRLSRSSIRTAMQNAEEWTPEDTPPPAADPAALRFTQYALNKLGLEAGPADGVPGVRSQAAIDGFRAELGMPPGPLNDHVLERLRERLAAMGG